MFGCKNDSGCALHRRAFSYLILYFNLNATTWQEQCRVSLLCKIINRQFMLFPRLRPRRL